MNTSHQYPDGMFLFTGTMFAPVQDRDPKTPGPCLMISTLYPRNIQARVSHIIFTTPLLFQQKSLALCSISSTTPIVFHLGASVQPIFYCMCCRRTWKPAKVKLQH